MKIIWQDTDDIMIDRLVAANIRNRMEAEVMAQALYQIPLGETQFYVIVSDEYEVHEA